MYSNFSLCKPCITHQVTIWPSLCIFKYFIQHAETLTNVKEYFFLYMSHHSFMKFIHHLLGWLNAINKGYDQLDLSHSVIIMKTELTSQPHNGSLTDLSAGFSVIIHAMNLTISRNLLCLCVYILRGKSFFVPTVTLYNIPQNTENRWRKYHS